MSGDIKSDKVEFICPNDVMLERDDVVFLCNTCEQADMKYINDMYICPACLSPGKNFECMFCESKDVEMKVKR